MRTASALGVPVLHRLFVVAMIPPLMCSTSGCSFVFTETVPDNPRQLKYFDCTNTPGLAVADGVIGVTSAVSGVTTFTQSKEEFEAKNDGASRDLVGGVALGVAAVMLASGVYGLLQSESCRHAKNELEARLTSPKPEAHTTRSIAPAPAEAQPPAGQPGEIKMLEIPPEQAPPPAKAP